MTIGARIPPLPCPQGPLLIAAVEYTAAPRDRVTSTQLPIPQVQFRLQLKKPKRLHLTALAVTDKNREQKSITVFFQNSDKCGKLHHGR